MKIEKIEFKNAWRDFSATILALGLLTQFSFTAQAASGEDKLGRAPASIARFPTSIQQISQGNKIIRVDHPEWLELAERLESGEEQAEAASAQLQKIPRQELVKAVQHWLRTADGDVQSTGFSLITAMSMDELKGELMRNAVQSDAWRLYHALNSILIISDKAAVVKIYEKRLQAKLPAATTMAIIDGLSGLKSPLPPVLFRKFQASASYQVREAAVQNFLVTRSNLPKGEQIERMKSSLQIKPYEVRLAAYKYYQALPVGDRKLLASAFDPSACRVDGNNEVKAVCAAIAESSKAVGR